MKITKIISLVALLAFVSSTCAYAQVCSVDNFVPCKEQATRTWKIKLKEEYSTPTDALDEGCSKTSIGIAKKFKLGDIPVTICPLIKIYAKPQDGLTKVKFEFKTCFDILPYLSVGATYKHGFSQVKGKPDTDELELWIKPHYKKGNFSIYDKFEYNIYLDNDGSDFLENELGMRYLFINNKETKTQFGPCVTFTSVYDLDKSDWKKHELGPGIYFKKGSFSITAKYLFIDCVAKDRSEEQLKVELCYSF